LVVKKFKGRTKSWTRRLLGGSQIAMDARRSSILREAGCQEIEQMMGDGKNQQGILSGANAFLMSVARIGATDVLVKSNLATVVLEARVILRSWAIVVNLVGYSLPTQNSFRIAQQGNKHRKDS
jgi:hypothetical protein